MASPTRWAWVWVNSRSWWWTGRPGVLWFMGLQRVRHDWATELTEWWEKYGCWALCLFLRLWLNVVLVAELPFPPSFSFTWCHTCYWHLATPLEEVMSPSSDSSLWHIQLWSDPSYLFKVSLFLYLLSIRLVSFHCPTNAVVISGFCLCSFPPAKPFLLLFSPIQIPLALQSPNRIYFFKCSNIYYSPGSPNSFIINNQYPLIIHSYNKDFLRTTMSYHHPRAQDTVRQGLYPLSISSTLILVWKTYIKQARQVSSITLYWYKQYEKKIKRQDNGNPLQYSWWENSMDRGAWRATVHAVMKVSDMT